MNTKIVLGSICGAVVVHAVLAACSGNKGASAQSAPTPVQVVVANCDQTFQVASSIPNPDGGPGLVPGNQTIYYAEASFPGLSAQQLAGHVTNWNAPTPGDFTPPGYTLRVYTKDGTVGAGCSQGSTSTFVYAP
jgi:hypothetical protein